MRVIALLLWCIPNRRAVDVEQLNFGIGPQLRHMRGDQITRQLLFELRS